MRFSYALNTIAALGHESYIAFAPRCLGHSHRHRLKGSSASAAGGATAWQIVPLQGEASRCSFCCCLGSAAGCVTPNVNRSFNRVVPLKPSSHLSSTVKRHRRADENESHEVLHFCVFTRGITIAGRAPWVRFHDGRGSPQSAVSPHEIGGTRAKLLHQRRRCGNEICRLCSLGTFRGTAERGDVAAFDSPTRLDNNSITVVLLDVKKALCGRLSGFNTSTKKRDMTQRLPTTSTLR